MGGAVPRGITAAAVDDYCARQWIDGEDAELLQHLVQQLDGVFFAHHQEASEKARKQQEKRP
ncbi:hypothetical protein [Pseudoroseomonas ludipueritiae]|uniref:Uncharacterized protein n=1 Tax=Pseudoroseomonas ludipueritiae TaxID=198093 RepID=A0ABR7R9V4_9PROT|nr:hypothetical protein [Pseudoroseomonas ludipueritiae]MBC9178570.1 hypothetical protein [Pseudoroseomonas ludipueritiae]MCG7363192.1 hypothetical protein [Roseomonas sp. ACRSG]